MPTSTLNLRPLLLLALPLVLHLAPAAAATDDRDLEAIYGQDDRRELNDPANTPRMRAAAAAVAVILPRTSIMSDQASASMKALPRQTLGAKFDLCAGERFADQPAPGYCTGFLVGPDLLITAGHCVLSSADCANIAVVFGFALGQSGADPARVRAADVFTCHSLAASKDDRESGIDFAVLRLDRKVRGRTPLKLRASGDVTVGEPLTVIGHPNGLPLKIAAGGAVRSADAVGWFVTDNDTFIGNSGSPVISDTTGLVEGIVVRGDTDWDTTPTGCRVAHTSPQDGGRGEDVTRASMLRAALPAP